MHGRDRFGRLEPLSSHQHVKDGSSACRDQDIGHPVIVVVLQHHEVRTRRRGEPSRFEKRLSLAPPLGTSLARCGRVRVDRIDVAAVNNQGMTVRPTMSDDDVRRPVPVEITAGERDRRCGSLHARDRACETRNASDQHD